MSVSLNKENGWNILTTEAKATKLIPNKGKAKIYGSLSHINEQRQKGIKIPIIHTDIKIRPIIFSIVLKF